MNNKYADLVEKLRDYSNVSLYAREFAARELLKQAADVIEFLSAELEKQENDCWIKCSEKMPGDDDDYEVLCCDKYGEMLIAHPYADDVSDTGFTAESDEVIMYKCVAWQPLPEPYKESEENTE